MRFVFKEHSKEVLVYAILKTVIILFFLFVPFYLESVTFATNSDLYNIQPTTITPTSITISWVTTTASTSKVEYGTTTSYGSTQTSGTLTQNHSITLTGLRPHTLYHYRVGTIDGSTRSEDYTVSTDLYMGLVKSSVSDEVDNTQLNTEYAMGVRYKTLELAWDRYETNNNFWNTTYINEKLAEYQAYTNAGFQVVLDLGMQYPGSWVKTLDSNTYFVNQYGDSYQPAEPGKQVVNVIFNKTVRDALGVYIQKVFDDFGTDFYAVRLGGIVYGELHYPDENYNSKTNSFWGYDANSQGTGNNLPTGINANPVPGWIPNPVANGTFENDNDGKWAFGSTSSIVADAHRGSKALKMSNPGSFINQTVQDVRVVAGRTYRYSFWAKTNNPAVGACLQIRTTSDAEMVAPTCTTGTSFTQVTGTFTPTQNIARMALLTNDAVSGLELTFDDVELLANGYTYDASHANATSWWNWYVASLTNFQTWQIDQLDTAGFTNNIFILYPGWAIRKQATVNQVTESINYDLSYTPHANLTGEMQTGNDWEAHISALPSRSTIFPYATWMERTADEANSNKKEWSPAKYLGYLATNAGFNYWGENAGQDNASEQTDTFTNLTDQGYYGLLWFSEQELFSGSYATPSNLATRITAIDSVAPFNGSISINSGAATTASLSATLTISAIDNYTTSPNLQMEVSEDSAFAGSSYESYATTKNWALSSGYGTKTVYLRFKDEKGNVSTTVQDSISYPDPAPRTTTTTATTPATSTPQPVGCAASPPGKKPPLLYGAVPLSTSSVLLYFAPGDQPFNHYSLAFGTQTGNYSYGIAQFGGSTSRTFVVENLQPNTTYYFKLRAGNDCAPGEWSNEKSAKTWRSFWRQNTRSTLTKPITTNKPSNSKPIKSHYSSPTPSATVAPSANPTSQNKKPIELPAASSAQENSDILEKKSPLKPAKTFFQKIYNWFFK